MAYVGLMSSAVSSRLGPVASLGTYVDILRCGVPYSYTVNALWVVRLVVGKVLLRFFCGVPSYHDKFAIGSARGYFYEDLIYRPECVSFLCIVIVSTGVRMGMSVLSFSQNVPS